MEEQQDPRVYFAAERTFLAWIRTGLGLMGIGFAVSRFGLFLREIAPTQNHTAIPTTGVSVWSGIALVALGVIVTLGSVFRHIQLIRELRTGSWRPGQVSRDGIILGVILGIVGIGMAIYLVTIR